MVEIFKKIVGELKAEYPRLALLAVVRMDEFANTWTVIFSAENVGDNNKDGIYKTISALIDKHAGKEAPSISRVGIFESDYYLVKELRKLNENELKNTKVNGNVIHDGYIIYPEKPPIPKRNNVKM
jgi:hypothetical protein